MSARRDAGFTLLELMISSALALLMAGLSISAFIQTRKMVQRAEARLAMYASAQRLHTYLNRTLASLQQSCVVVGFSTVATRSGDATDPGMLKLVFMRGKEHLWDFAPPDTTALADAAVTGDLVWEELEWRRATGALRSGASSQGTPAAPGRWFTPTASSFVRNGINYGGQRFTVAPRPRRRVDPTSMATVVNGLNDDLLFPDGSAVPVSAANAIDDVGDLTDAERNLAPLLERVSDLSLQIVAHDGTVSDLTDGATRNPPLVLQGVWLDGRLAPTLDAAPAFAGSDLAKRPRLLRLRFTLVDDLRRPDLSCTFSFSFALPGLAR